MSLLSNQACFLDGLAVTIGEAFRTKEQQEIHVKAGRSATMNSMHLKRCAIDLNVFKLVDGGYQLLSDPILGQEIGKYWKSLDEKNRWGGDWKKPFDPWHFERKV